MIFYAKVPPRKIEGLRSVRSLTLAGLWRELELEVEMTPPEVRREFCPRETREVKLVTYYRGRPVSGYSAECLNRVLAAPEHQLSDSEREDVEVVLDNMSEPDFFDLYSLRTETIKGRRVLLAEGLWKRSSLRNLAMFIGDAEDTGEIQEIHYLAPEELYDTYLETARKMFESIEWQDDG